MRLIIEEELPFTAVNAPAFREFVELCNPAVVLEGVGLSAGLVLCARAVSVN